MATGTLNELSKGRVGFVGLGIGYKARIEQYFGLKIAKHNTTAARMKEYVEIMRTFIWARPFLL